MVRRNLAAERREAAEYRETAALGHPWPNNDGVCYTVTGKPCRRLSSMPNDMVEIEVWDALNRRLFKTRVTVSAWLQFKVA